MPNPVQLSGREVSFEITCILPILDHLHSPVNAAAERSQKRTTLTSLTSIEIRDPNLISFAESHCILLQTHQHPSPQIHSHIGCSCCQQALSLRIFLRSGSRHSAKFHFLPRNANHIHQFYYIHV